MARRNITGCVDMHVRYQYDNQLCENVWSFHYTGAAPNGTELAALITEWESRSMSAFRALFTSAVQFNSVYARDIDESHPDANFIDFFPAGTVGTHSGSPAPGTNSCSLLLSSGLAGHAHHGRKSLGPIATTDFSQNELNTAFLNLVIAFITTIINSYVSGRFNPVIASQKFNGWDLIRSMGVPNNSVDSQKTRLTGRGR